MASGIKLKGLDKEFEGGAYEDGLVLFNVSDMYSIDKVAMSSCIPSSSPQLLTPKRSSFASPAKSITSGQRTPNLKSPFSISSFRASSPLPSPQSSTPISADVSFTRSFETPSFHSPIFNIDDVFRDRSNLGLVSDTVLAWDAQLETPTQQEFVTPQTFVTPPRRKKVATKKLFVSPTNIGQKQQTKMSTNTEPCLPMTAPTTDPIKGTAGVEENIKQVQEIPTENIILLKDCKDELMQSPIRESVVSEEKPRKVQMQEERQNVETPIKAENCVANKSPKVDVLCKLDEVHQPGVIQNITDRSATKTVTDDKVSTVIEPIATEERLSVNDDSLPVNSMPVFSMNTTASHSSPTKVSKFQYPTVTQNMTQLHDGKDSCAFSQWTDDVFEQVEQALAVTMEETKTDTVPPISSHNEIDDTFALTQWHDDFDHEKVNAAVTEFENRLRKKEALRATVQGALLEPDEKKEAPPKYDSTTELQDSLLMSQWTDDVCEQLEKVVSTLEKKHTPIRNASLIDTIVCNERPAVDCKPIKTDSDKLSTVTNNVPTKVKSAANFFGEDFSDLNGLNSVSFKVATFCTTKKPKPLGKDNDDQKTVNSLSLKCTSATDTVSKCKNANAFFGEDFSDLKLNSVPSGFSNFGFMAASKVLEDEKENKAFPAESTNSKRKYGGFATAAGAPVAVLKKSLDHIISSQIKVAFTETTDLCDAMADTRVQKDVGLNERDTEYEEQVISSKDDESLQLSDIVKFGGFSTAAGAGVGVSKTSLDFVRSSQVTAPATSKSMVNTGFATAAGGKIDVRKESMDFIKSSQAPAVEPKTSLGDLKQPLNMAKLARSDSTVQPSSSPNLDDSFEQFKNKAPAVNCKRVRPSSDGLINIAKHPRKAAYPTESPRSHRVEIVIEDESLNRLRQRSNVDHSSPQSLNKRRKLSRRVAFNSPVTDKAKTRGLVSSPIGHRMRPGLSPLLCSPKLQSTLDEAPADQQSTFVTPYNKSEPDKPGTPEPTKTAPSLLWKRNYDDLRANTFVKPSNNGMKRPLQCMPVIRIPYDSDKLYELGVSPGVADISSQNAQSFTFSRPGYFSETQSDTVRLPDSDAQLTLHLNTSAGWMEFYNALMGVKHIKKAFITKEWVANHYRWIVWKCAKLEQYDPLEHAGTTLTPGNVMRQLLLRYTVEVEEGLRSAIRKITEKDDSASKPLTLLVSAINRAERSMELEVTDGWYSLECVVDTPLSVILEKKILAVGHKIVSFCSGIVGTHSDGIPPLQAKGVIKLKLNYNSVRAVMWHARLGYTDTTAMPVLPLAVLSGDGGVCACIRAVIIRRYPIQYMETIFGGKKEFLSVKQEFRRQEQHERTRERAIEQIGHKMQGKREGNGSKKRRITKSTLKDIETGQELYEMLEGHPDPTSVHVLLTSSQLELLRDYSEKEHSRVKNRQKKEMFEELEEQCPPRKVISLTKYKVKCNYGSGGYDTTEDSSHTFMTVWRSDSQDHLREGRCYKIYNVAASVYGGRAMSLSSVKGTQYRQLPGDYSHFSNKLVCSVSQIPATISECDVVGRVLEVKQLGGKPADRHDVVVLADGAVAVQLTLRGNTSVVDLADAVKVGRSVVVINLQVTRQGKLYTNEKSTVSASPKDLVLSSKLNEFSARLSTKPAVFWESLLSSTLTSILDNTPGASPESAVGSTCDAVPDLPPMHSFDTTPQHKAKPGLPVPLFSKSTLEWENLPASADLTCSDRAKSDFVTPVKPKDYNAIFE